MLGVRLWRCWYVLVSKNKYAKSFELLFGWYAGSAYMRCLQCNISVGRLRLVCTLWRKVIASLSWKLTFVLIKASVLVPDRINWQVGCLHSMPPIYRPVCGSNLLAFVYWWLDLCIIFTGSRWSCSVLYSLKPWLCAHYALSMLPFSVRWCNCSLSKEDTQHYLSFWCLRLVSFDT